MKRYIVALFVTIFLVSSVGGIQEQANAQDTIPIPLTLESSSENGVVFNVNLDWQTVTVEPVSVDGQDFVSVTLPDTTTRTIPGEPEIPILTKMIAVPFGSAVDIVVTPGPAHTYQLDAPVLPTSTQTNEMPLPGESPEDMLLPRVSSQVVPGSKIYQSNNAFPGIFGEISNDGVIRQQRVAGISLYPVQYEPVTGKLTVYESLHVEVTFKGTPDIAPKKAARESEAYEDYFSANLINYRASADWRLPKDSIEKTSSGSFRAGSLPWTPPDPGWRINVRETGFYRLTYAELQTAGLPVDTLDPTTFQVFNQGSEVAIEVEGEDNNQFEPGEFIQFYATAYEDKYTQENVYWLTYGSQAGVRTDSRDVTPSDGTLAESYTKSLHLEQNLVYFNYMPGEDDLERWIWGGAYNILSKDKVYQADWTCTFNITSGPSANAVFVLSLYGASYYSEINPDHHAIVKINGNIVDDDVRWDGPTGYMLVTEIPSGYLNVGSNTIVVTMPRDNGVERDYVYVDWAKITYSRSFQVVDNQLTFTYEPTGISKFQVDGFTSATPLLYDVTDPWNVVSLSGAEVQGSESPYSLVYEDNLAAPVTYHADAGAHYLTVQSIALDTPSSLQTGSADYILITHADFTAQAADLVAYREGQGLRAVLVDVQDIYDQFGFGITGVAAIKAFLAYTYDHWTSPAPSYVLLVGDGHYNPKGFNPPLYGTLRTNYLPPFLAYVDTSAYPTTETAADNQYVTLAGEDNLPDMMLGRLAVTTPDEVTAYLEKVMVYEQVPANADWKNQILAVADNVDAAGNFPVITENLLTCCMPKRYEAERIYQGVNYSMNSTAGRLAVIAGINSGKFIVNYQGHGANSQLGYNIKDVDQPLFIHTDIPSLTNSSTYPIVLSMTCNVGFYINPQAPGGNYDSLASLLTNASGKGAIATWASTGTGIVSGHIPLNQGFYNAIFKNNANTIGTATNDAKADLWATGANLELIDTYLLFGDPALQVTITPGAPTGYAPSGLIASLNPTFTWSEVPNAEYYNLVLTQGGGVSSPASQDEITPSVMGDTIILDTYILASACAARTCTFTPSPSLNLEASDFYWKIRAYMGDEYTEFSDVIYFLNLEAVEPKQPSGTQTTRNPRFTWKPVTDATKYKLRISQGSTTIKVILIDEPDCPVYLCNYRSPTSLKLANGDYQFSVKSYFGFWGDYGWPIDFTIASPPAPKYPAISTTSPNPKFVWMKVADQTKYQVILYDSDGTVLMNKVMDPPLCGTARCRYIPDPELSLLNGTYKWKVRGYNSMWGNYSGLKTFEKVDPPAPISPAGTIKNANPEFTWVKIPGATKYAIKIQKPNGDAVKYLGVDASHCGTTYCNYVPDPSINLANGIYKWRVRAYNGYFGPYSDFLYFTKK